HSFGIDRRLTWAGIGRKRLANGIVTFEQFALFDKLGALFEERGPRLAQRRYGKNVRVLVRGYPPREQAEAEDVLRWSRSRKAQRLNDKGNRTWSSGCRSRCKRVTKPSRC